MSFFRATTVGRFTKFEVILTDGTQYTFGNGFIESTAEPKLAVFNLLEIILAQRVSTHSYYRIADHGVDILQVPNAVCPSPAKVFKVNNRNVGFTTCGYFTQSYNTKAFSSR